jgi:hypothetical protein
MCGRELEAVMSRSRQELAGALVLALTLTGGAWAQEPTWTKPAPATAPASATQQAPTPVPAASNVQSQSQAQAPAAPASAVETPPQAAVTAPAPPKHPTMYVPVAGKKNKFEYVGPKTVVELAPTPMLDEEGRQRLDPDGKPMFNPPIRQQRDKHGNPLFDDRGKPVMQTPSEMGYDEKGKKIHDKKEKPPKMVSVSIERGTLTVDGLTGKAGLNYEIKDLKYIYLYAPWIGITVVSTSPFPGAKEQPNAFNDKTLTVTVEDHTLQLYSDKRLLGKKPEAAFVAVDRNFKLPSKFPVVGYGETLKPPYAWPGSRENAALNGPIAPPPLPVSLRPVVLLQPCPPGQMRMPGKTPLPGETQATQPCVPIGKALPGTGAPKAVSDTKSSAPPAAPAPAAPNPALPVSAQPPAPTTADATPGPAPAAAPKPAPQP